MDNTAVLDIGSHSIKCGLSTSASPQLIPCIAGECKYKPAFHLAAQGTMSSSAPVRMAGVQVLQGANRGLLRLTYPVRHGTIVDWPAFSVLLQQSQKAALNNNTSSAAGSTALHAAAAAVEEEEEEENGGGLVASAAGMTSAPPSYYAVVEQPFAARTQRQRIAEMLFESAQDATYHDHSGARGVFFGVAPLLSLYSTGETSGVVLDVGDGVVSTAAALQGFALTSVMQREDGGATGGNVTAYLEQLMRVNGTYQQYAMTNQGTVPSPSHPFGLGGSAEREIVREVKEACCRVSESPVAPFDIRRPAEQHSASVMASLDNALSTYTAEAQRHPRQAHRLPDGTELSIGLEAYQAPEVLFQPSLVGSEGRGIVDMVLSTVNMADMDLRPSLLGNVLLTGGSSLVAGLGPRFLSELLRRTPRDAKVRVVAPAERGHAAWLGAAFVSQLSTFPSMLVTRQEWMESGESILQARLFA